MLLAWRPCSPTNSFEFDCNYFDLDFNPQQLKQTTLDLSLAQVDLLVTRRQFQSYPRPYANSMGKTSLELFLARLRLRLSNLEPD